VIGAAAAGALVLGIVFVLWKHFRRRAKPAPVADTPPASWPKGTGDPPGYVNGGLVTPLNGAGKNGWATHSSADERLENGTMPDELSFLATPLTEPKGSAASIEYALPFLLSCTLTFHFHVLPIRHAEGCCCRSYQPEEVLFLWTVGGTVVRGLSLQRLVYSGVSPDDVC
jgi:hypothetical protein